MKATVSEVIERVHYLELIQGMLERAGVRELDLTWCFLCGMLGES